MGSKRYAVLATLEWSDRKKDGTSKETRVEAGEVRSDLPAESINALLQSKAIEPYNSAKHKEGWHARRQQAMLDKATVAKGGVPRSEMVEEPGGRNIAVNDTGESKETPR